MELLDDEHAVRHHLLRSVCLRIVADSLRIVHRDFGSRWLVRSECFGRSAPTRFFAYVLHDIVGDAVKKFVPRDAPPFVMWISFGVLFLVCWLFVRSLEKKNIYIKL